MDSYALVKTLHIMSAMVLFGTGLGIAFFFWMGGRSGDDRAALFAARATVTADVLFTLTAVIAQPLTGAWLVWRGGFGPFDQWLVLSYALYLAPAGCPSFSSRSAFVTSSRPNLPAARSTPGLTGVSERGGLRLAGPRSWRCSSSFT